MEFAGPQPPKHALTVLPACSPALPHSSSPAINRAYDVLSSPATNCQVCPYNYSLVTTLSARLRRSTDWFDGLILALQAALQAVSCLETVMWTPADRALAGNYRWTLPVLPRVSAECRSRQAAA
jgi:hypothetical protein